MTFSIETVREGFNSKKYALSGRTTFIAFDYGSFIEDGTARSFLACHFKGQ